MIRQYYASRSCGGPNPSRVDVIAVASMQDQSFFRDRYGGTAARRAPWIVEAFLNATLAAAHRNPETGRWEDRFMSGPDCCSLVARRPHTDGERTNANRP